nr:peptidase domain-containing ABC transporter [Dyella flagellata]
MPLIRQGEAAECGLACLAMLAGYHGYHIGLTALRRQFSLSLKGMDMARLIEMAESLQLAGRPLQLELDELNKLRAPCILHWDLDHFVVLRNITKTYLVIHDPAMGIRKLPLARVGKHFTGIALELSKGPAFQRKRPSPPISIRKLAGEIHGLGRSLAQIFALALVLEVAALLSPQFLQLVVDQVLADGDKDFLGLLGISFILLLLIQIGVSALRSWVVMWIGTHFNLSWTGNVFQHLMRLPQDYFIKRHLGDVVSRFGSVAAIQQTLTTQFVAVMLDGLMAGVTLAMLFIYSPPLALITLVAVVIYALLRVLYFSVYREANLSQIVVAAKQQSCFMEAVRGIQTIRLFNQGAKQTSRYLNATSDSLNTSIAVQRLGLLFGSLNGLTGGLQRIVVLWLGASLALKGQLTAGMLMAFVAYADQFAGRAANLVDYVIQFRMLGLQGERLADIVLTPPEPFAEGTYVGPTPEASIRFDNVSFRYADGEPWVFDHCSFEIRRGESVAIVGPSGCGKSTLLRLLLGLLDPQSGTISVGGIDLRNLGKKAYRRMISSVMQDDQLFAGSIADNISFFDEGATPERIEKAALIAHLHQDIIEMPMGYHSLVGDMGSSLSGGQKQRLSIARALYRDASILVLDEATSHLDLDCEARICAELKQLNLTRVVVAHRPETIAGADRILVVCGQTVRDASSHYTERPPVDFHHGKEEEGAD